MKHLYILKSVYNSVLFTFEIDSIISDSKENEVTVLFCDGCVNRCNDNVFGLRLLCSECKKRTLAVLDSIPNIKILKASNFFDSDLKYKKYNYNSLGELNKIQYNGFEIGYGVSSYYISLTRNLNPDITPKLKKLLDVWLENSMKYADIANKVITKEFDMVYVPNGRMFDAKPFQEAAFAKGIPVILGECATNMQGQYVRMNFNNVRVHSVEGNSRNINTFWNSSNIPIDERRKIAASFFEKRSNAIKTNDKVYVKNQEKGLLPANWNEHKTNIAIFNSSEDEFAAIGGDYEIGNLFDSQLSGIKYVLENTKDPSIHFYLRIHPNLMNIKYKYHTDLYNLPEQYNNVTVIPGNSPVSSYTLMSSCDRVITFGSTMGIEAAYAGKPAMVLHTCFYSYLGVNFVPKTLNEVVDFIYGKINFEPIRENVLKYSYYYFNDERGFVDNIKCKMNPYPIQLGKRTITFYCMNLACSNLRMKYYTYLGLFGVVMAKLFVPKKEK